MTWLLFVHALNTHAGHHSIVLVIERVYDLLFICRAEQNDVMNPKILYFIALWNARARDVTTAIAVVTKYPSAFINTHIN